MLGHACAGKCGSAAASLHRSIASVPLALLPVIPGTICELQHHLCPVHASCSLAIVACQKFIGLVQRKSDCLTNFTKQGVWAAFGHGLLSQCQQSMYAKWRRLSWMQQLASLWCTGSRLCPSRTLPTTWPQVWRRRQWQAQSTPQLILEPIWAPPTGSGMLACRCAGHAMHWHLGATWRVLA